jgi:anti-sigma factor RsiW
MTNPDITCEAFDGVLPDYLEGTLDGSLRSSVERHLRECLRCASLVRDIENIRSEAAALPDLVPARDLWAGIEARIAAPVVPLAAPFERQRRLAPAWMGVAAAALIVSSAGLTYLLTARSVPPGDVRPAPGSPVAQTETTNVATKGPLPAATASVSPGVSRRSRDQPGGSRLAQSATARSRSDVPASLVSRKQSGPSRSESVYGKEIEMLQNIVSRRKAQLDPSTVAIIYKNLQIIDSAIEQSKAALAKDPASMLLSQQLTHALDKKVELLRTAAMLPSST